jgi:hypothetical protein
MSAVFIAIVHILRGASNHHPQTARRGHLTHLAGHDVSVERIELPTLHEPEVPPADSFNILPVYDNDRLPGYPHKYPEAPQGQVAEPGARPLPLATGDEEEIDLGTPQAIPQMESANPISRPPAVRINLRVLERL